MLRLYNTMSRKKETFRPRRGKTVKMFTCGPSIYRKPHIGNYRSFVWEDVLQRYLEHLGYEVRRVINLTDVEDKALAEAAREGTALEKLTDAVTARFLADAEKLRIKLPDIIPRSSTSVDQSVKLIRILIDKGYAYRHGKDIYFDPLKVKGFGRLYRLDMSRWPKERRRFKQDTYPGRRWNLGDFILWHGCDDDAPVAWETEIGRGRPAWNIQDPAIITEHLGDRIDIACGGVDNLYRHHDYNIAVIEAASGKKPFARCWIHGEHLLSNGKKMSKSLGNIVYPSDLIEAGYSGGHIRFYLLYGRHRKKINLTTDGFRQACAKLDAFSGMVREIATSTPNALKTNASSPAVGQLIKDVTVRFKQHMDDDLDVKAAFDGVCECVDRLSRIKERGGLSDRNSLRALRALRKVDEVLRVIFE